MCKVLIMRLLWGYAAGIAMELTGRKGDAELREIGDERTERDLSDYELDKLVRLVKEHPAYEALPEEIEESPTTDCSLPS